jgi:hypothetical protein
MKGKSRSGRTIKIIPNVYQKMYIDNSATQKANKLFGVAVDVVQERSEKFFKSYQKLVLEQNQEVIESRNKLFVGQQSKFILSYKDQLTNKTEYYTANTLQPILDKLKTLGIDTYPKNTFNKVKFISVEGTEEIRDPKIYLTKEKDGIYYPTVIFKDGEVKVIEDIEYKINYINLRDALIGPQFKTVYTLNGKLASSVKYIKAYQDFVNTDMQINVAQHEILNEKITAKKIDFGNVQLYYRTAFVEKLNLIKNVDIFDELAIKSSGSLFKQYIGFNYMKSHFSSNYENFSKTYEIQKRNVLIEFGNWKDYIEHINNQKIYTQDEIYRLGEIINEPETKEHTKKAYEEKIEKLNVSVKKYVPLLYSARKWYIFNLIKKGKTLIYSSYFIRKMNYTKMIPFLYLEKELMKEEQELLYDYVQYLRLNYLGELYEYANNINNILPKSINKIGFKDVKQYIDDTEENIKITELENIDEKQDIEIKEFGEEEKEKKKEEEEKKRFIQERFNFGQFINPINQILLHVDTLFYNIDEKIGRFYKINYLLHETEEIKKIEKGAILLKEALNEIQFI